MNIPRSALSLLVACATFAVGCEGGAAPPMVSDAGTDGGMRGCPEPDGTALGDCMRYSCLVRNHSVAYCSSGLVYNFDCTGIDAFPEEYVTRIRTYFTDCNEALGGIMDTDVPVMGGTYRATRCQILGCAVTPNSGRLFMGMPGVFRAECAPTPAPACDFPDPPAP